MFPINFIRSRRAKRAARREAELAASSRVVEHNHGQEQKGPSTKVKEVYAWDDWRQDGRAPSNFSSTRGGYGDVKAPSLTSNQAVLDEKAARARQVIIAVMGVTGAGKSSFIRRVTGRNDIFVGHDLSSATSEVESFKFTHQGIDFVIVDTPGFDDSNKNDDVIVTKILEWLESSFRDGIRLSGLIYLHRIIDPRIRGSARQNLRMFRQLCGPDCVPNIVLGTTFWAQIKPEQGAAREKELCENNEFWGELVKKGSRVVRIKEDRESGLNLLLEIAKNDPLVLQAQREMVQESKSARETAAARPVNEEMEKMEREMRAKAKSQREAAAQEIARRDAARREELRQEKLKQERIVREKAQKEKERLEREKREYWERYRKEQEKARREAEEERARQKREEARIEREKEAERARQERLDQEAREARQVYMANYVCVRKAPSTLYCDKCRVRLTGSYFYYHCCHCHDDNYDHCIRCGNDCGESEHPYMKKFEHSDCVVM